MERRVRLVPALLDVAIKAGVGAATVSRVINGGRNVSQETMAAVTAAIRELGYIPSHAARSLKGARTKTIGLILPSVADPFFSSAAAAIEKVAARNGCLVLLASSENHAQKELELLTTFLQRRIDGLILAPSGAKNGALLARAGFPTVCFDRSMRGSAISAVVADNLAGARTATTYLLDLGYRRILCLGGYCSLPTSQKRFQGHREAIRKAGLPYLAEQNVEDFASAEEALERHLGAAKPPDAVFSIKNSTTIDAYRILRERGLHIPEDLGLLGYDDFELADALDPPISVIRQPVTEIATRAAELLFLQMETGQPSTGVITLPVELVVRGSCSQQGTKTTTKARRPRSEMP